MILPQNYKTTVKLQWLEQRWLVYFGLFKLVWIPKAQEKVYFRIFISIIKNVCYVYSLELFIEVILMNTLIIVQSNLVISNSLISNYRLSRSENLVPVLTWNYDNR